MTLRNGRPSAAKSALKLAAKLLISAACFAYLIYRLDGDAIKKAVLTLDASLFAAAVSIFVVLAGIQTFRWLMVARVLSVWPVTWGVALQSVLVGMFFNQTLPSSMGGDAVRVWRLRSLQAPLGTILNSVVLERLSALAGMVLLSILSFPLLLEHPTQQQLLFGLVALDLAVVVGLVVLATLDKLPLPRFMRTDKAALLIIGFAVDLRRLAKSRTVLYVLGVSVLIHVAVSIAFWLLAKAVDVQISAALCVAFVPVILLVTTLPISIAGWGVREGAAVAIFGLAGTAPEQAVAVSIVFGLAVAVAAMPGGVVWLLTRSRPRLTEDQEQVGA